MKLFWKSFFSIFDVCGIIYALGMLVGFYLRQSDLSTISIVCCLADVLMAWAFASSLKNRVKVKPNLICLLSALLFCFCVFCSFYAGYFAKKWILISTAFLCFFLITSWIALINKSNMLSSKKE